MPISLFVESYIYGADLEPESAPLFLNLKSVIRVWVIRVIRIVRIVRPWIVVIRKKGTA